MSLFWRIFGLNAVVLGSATALLLWAPVTVSVPVVLTEAVILVGGLVVMLVANAALLRWGLSPLDRLTRLMTTVDLLRPGQRLPAHGGGEVADLIRTFNAMLDRLEQERATSSARVLLAQEAERRRIAQELHDEVGQSMTAILLALKRAADAADPPLRDELHQAQEITRESLDEVRRLVRRLRPGVLDDLGLVAALTSLTSDFATHTGLRVVRRFDAELPALDPETELVLYRVAQESLTNAARHADAERVEVALTRADGAVVLAITDDGRGIKTACEGAGIRGMRERALLIGAALDITDAAEGPGGSAGPGGFGGNGTPGTSGAPGGSSTGVSRGSSTGVSGWSTAGASRASAAGVARGATLADMSSGAAPAVGAPASSGPARPAPADATAPVRTGTATGTGTGTGSGTGPAAGPGTRVRLTAPLPSKPRKQP
ncbi:HAMP domain-containing sensor histidine kinase [Streptomyces sp. RCPT1-4]|nr:HAMP domain-containing sensor histidine kinase [Streptomyces sennicomposti]